MGNILKIISAGADEHESYAPSQSLRPRYSKVTALLRTLDAVTIYIAFGLSVYLTGQSLMGSYVSVGVVALLAFVFIAEYSELYCEWKSRSLTDELSQIAVAWGYTVVLITVISIVLALLSESPSWSQIMTWLFLSPALILMMYGYRRIVTSVKAGAERQQNSNVAIVGASELVSRFVSELAHRPGFEYKSIKYYDERQADRTPEEVQIQLEASVAASYGSLDDLYEEARSGAVDVVYIIFPMRAEARIKEIIERLSDSTASVFIVPDFFSFKLLDGRLSNVQGLPLVSVFDSPFESLDGVFKRWFDLVFSILALILFSIPMLVVSLAVKVSSPGPVLFKQKRYGIQGEEIEVWKFRSMTVSENGANVTQAIKNDPRVTFVGRIIRKTSLDELPQFFNVLMGTMSIVGPRPHAVAHNEQYREQIKGYMLRHKVKPGITGLAQINGFRGETDTLDKMEGRIRYDLEYIQQWTLKMDLKIMLLTPIKGLIGVAVY